MAEVLALLGLGVYFTVRNYETQAFLEKLRLEDLPKVNDRFGLLFDKKKYTEANAKLGNWLWDGQNTKPPLTRAWFREPTPQGAELIDWTHEGNQWLRGPEFRKLYVENYRNANGTENAFSIRSGLVSGYQPERITKGRVLRQTSTSDGVYNDSGPNLYLYHSK